MAAKADTYEVLGVPSGAGLHELRQAYRKAALRYHPDIRGGDREAERKFSEVTTAYRAALRSLASQRPADDSRQVDEKFAPQDFARLEVGWYQAPRAAGAAAGGGSPWRGRPGTQRLSLASMDEPAVFVCLWLLALGLALAAPAVLWPVTGALRVTLLLVLPPVIYAAVVATAMVGLVATRKIVWLIGELGFRGRRALPPGRAGKPPLAG